MTDTRRKSQWREAALLALLLPLGSLIARGQAPAVRRSETRIEIRDARAGGVLPPVRVPLADVEPFLAVGLLWEADARAGAGVRIELRGSADGATWTPWREVPRDDDADLSPGTFAGALSLLDRGTVWVQARWIATPPGADLRGLRWIFISPGATPAPLRDRIEEKSRPPMTAQQQPSPKYPKPPVVSRTEWGCPDGQVTTHGALSYTTVTHLIVHHTATGNTAAGNDWAAVVRSIWNLHIFTNGWADIGYNYLIDPNGVVYEGRAGGDNVLGAHFSGVNAGTMGVSMIGTYTDVVPTEKAQASLRKVLAWKADQRGIDPEGAALHAASGLTLKTVSGHRDGPGATECPGNALYPLLPAIRTGVAGLLRANVGAVAAVSAASFQQGALAADSIASAFGVSMTDATLVATTSPLPTTLGGASLVLRDNANRDWPAPLFFVSPGQINFLVPAGIPAGPATLLVAGADGRLSQGALTIASIAPALFSADSTGKGLASAQVLRLRADGSQSYESLAAPIDFGAATDQLFLIAYGTGLRGRASLSAVSAQIGGLPVEVLYAGPVAGLYGLDQLNLRLPRSLAGRGPVTLEVSIEGAAANPLSLQFK